MEKLDAEGQAFRPPQRTVAAKANFPVFVVIQVVGLKHFGQIHPRRMEGQLRPLIGALRHVVQIDLRRFRSEAIPSHQNI